MSVYKKWFAIENEPMNPKEKIHAIAQRRTFADAERLFEELINLISSFGFIISRQGLECEIYKNVNELCSPTKKSLAYVCLGDLYPLSRRELFVDVDNNAPKNLIEIINLTLVYAAKNNLDSGVQSYII